MYELIKIAERLLAKMDEAYDINPYDYRDGLDEYRNELAHAIELAKSEFWS